MSDPSPPFSTPILDPTEVPKKSWLWLRDETGTPAPLLTFTTVAFWVTLAMYILSSFAHIGLIEMRPFDSAACGSFLAPILASYVGHRYITTKYG